MYELAYVDKLHNHKVNDMYTCKEQYCTSGAATVALTANNAPSGLGAGEPSPLAADDVRHCDGAAPLTSSTLGILWNISSLTPAVTASITSVESQTNNDITCLQQVSTLGVRSRYQ